MEKTKPIVAEGLRELAALYERHPQLEPPTIIIGTAYEPAECKEQVAAFIHGSPSPVTKESKAWADSDLYLSRDFSGLTVLMDVRKESMGCRKVMVNRPTEEWQCGPILDAIKEKRNGQ